MIAYLKGEITFKSPTYIIVEAGGIGYHVNISLFTYSRVEKLERVKLYTHLHIKEDSHTLYGFAEQVERHLFIQLISVSGIGPSTARLILSTLNPEELRDAIIGENEVLLKGVKGIGAKTAKRIILDLKDKLLKDSGGSLPGMVAVSSKDNTLRQEALSALVNLGFNKIAVQRVLNKVLKEKPEVRNVESLIKLALRQLA